MADILHMKFYIIIMLFRLFSGMLYHYYYSPDKQIMIIAPIFYYAVEGGFISL
ncbi:hypothetical protein XBO1_2090019 [Xenorhabdus bovienii str. oregonense]|uniref:Uncharacterized protein n=1 Tax=Xenorhabdus bovienii str. oregonense TaxID=1398202 RepID=A0A077P4H3_XENBV|nr:hypothetical protein XBO1_2090019 [Xenorhabdus bovienii str. oregonense]